MNVSESTAGLQHPFIGMLIRGPSTFFRDQIFQTGKHLLFKSFTANVKFIHVFAIMLTIHSPQLIIIWYNLPVDIFKMQQGPIQAALSSMSFHQYYYWLTYLTRSLRSLDGRCKPVRSRMTLHICAVSDQSIYCLTKHNIKIILHVEWNCLMLS